MPYFDYKARNIRGEQIQGRLEGLDTSAIATYLINIGATPVSISLAREQAGRDEPTLWDKLTTEKVSALDVQLFSRQLHTLLKAGVPIMKSLAGLEQSAVNKAFARVLRNIRESLDTGRELSAAMRNHPKVFSPYYISMVQVGEMTGRLTDIFPRLHDQIQFERSMREQVTTALRYPKFVVLAMIAAILVINMFVIPPFIKVFARANFELPMLTQFLLGSSQFTGNYWPYMLAGLLGTMLLFNAYVGTREGRYKWDRFKLKVPIAGSIVHKGTMARFARSFSLAYQSGIPIAQVLSLVARTVDNAYVAANVEQMRDGVERGETLIRTATTTGIFTPIVLQMIAVGEETGELDRLIEEVATMYEQEVAYELKTIASRIEPLVLIAMAIMVAVLALGVFMPMWQMTNIIH